MSNRTLRQQAGVSLVELIAFIVIVAVALAGIVGVMNLVTGTSADPLRRKQALMIAEGLLEEVRMASFTWCDPTSDDADVDVPTGSAACARPEVFGNEGPAVRPFDNINDYVSASGVAQAAFDIGGVLSNAAGAPIGVQGYSVRLTVVPETLHTIAARPAAPHNPADAEVLRIRVAVDYGGEAPLVLDGYRTRYMPGLR